MLQRYIIGKDTRRESEEKGREGLQKGRDIRRKPQEGLQKGRDIRRKPQEKGRRKRIQE